MNDTLQELNDVQMTYTGLLPGKKGKVIHVCFERTGTMANDYAEIQLPSRKVLHSKGFDEGEIAQLQLYLKTVEKDIIKGAKQINHDMIYKL